MSTLAYFELNTVKLFVLLVLVGGSKQHINPGECLCSTVEAVRYSRRGGGGGGGGGALHKCLQGVYCI